MPTRKTDPLYNSYVISKPEEYESVYQAMRRVEMERIGQLILSLPKKHTCVDSLNLTTVEPGTLSVCYAVQPELLRLVHALEGLWATSSSHKSGLLMLVMCDYYKSPTEIMALLYAKGYQVHGKMHYHDTHPEATLTRCGRYRDYTMLLRKV